MCARAGVYEIKPHTLVNLQYIKLNRRFYE